MARNNSDSTVARYVTFSKLKARLFRKANELSILTGADVGILLISPSGKPHIFGPQCIAKFLDWKPYDCENHHLDVVASDLGQRPDDICQDSEAENNRENEQKLSFESKHSGSGAPGYKDRLEQLVAIKKLMEKLKEKTENRIQELVAASSVAHPSSSGKSCVAFDLNVAAEADEGETSVPH